MGVQAHVVLHGYQVEVAHVNITCMSVKGCAQRQVSQHAFFPGRHCLQATENLNGTKSARLIAFNTTAHHCCFCLRRFVWSQETTQMMKPSATTATAPAAAAGAAPAADATA